MTSTTVQTAERVMLGEHRTEPVHVAGWEPPPWVNGRDDVRTDNDNGVVGHSVEVGEFRIAGAYLAEDGTEQDVVEAVSVCQTDTLDVTLPYVQVQRQPATVEIGAMTLSPREALRLAFLLRAAVRVLVPDLPDADVTP